MADYYGKCRSNYFKVKDFGEFNEWCIGLGLKLISEQAGTKVGFINEDGGVPSGRENDVSGEFEEIDFYKELSEHLEEGEVAIVQEIGSERMRYFVGESVAVNSKGKTAFVSIQDIYKKAAKLGDNVTKAEY